MKKLLKRIRKEKIKKLRFYWHIHHKTLCELLTEPIRNRIKYIKENKPAKEIALRLKLLKPVRSKLPARFIKASQECNKVYQRREKACQICDKACQRCDKAYQRCEKASQECKKAYQGREKAYRECLSQLEVLHKKECPNCPWNGKSIFPKEN